MTEYLSAGHQAYRRLKWAEENRPPPEELEKLKKAEMQDRRQQRVARFRKSIA